MVLNKSFFLLNSNPFDLTFNKTKEKLNYKIEEKLNAAKLEFNRKDI